jgi:hypothetical protein
MRRKVATWLVGMLLALGATIMGPFDPGIGACVPLPDPPLIDWTIRAIKVAIGGEVDCGL